MSDFEYIDESLQSSAPGTGTGTGLDFDYVDSTKDPNNQGFFSSVGDMGQAGMTGAADVATMGFGDEARAFVQASAHELAQAFGLQPEVAANVAYNHFLESYRQKQKQRFEDNAYSYMGGGVLGGLGAASLAPAGLVKGVGRFAHRGYLPAIAANVGTGALSGGVYGFGSGEGDAAQRAESAGLGAAFGVGGGLVGASVSPLAQRMMKLFQKKKVLPTKQMTDVVSPEDAQKMVRGEIIDISEGAATQKPKIQALEKAALKGALGDEAESAALRAQEAQQKQIRGLLEPLADEDKLIDAAQAVKGSFKSIKRRVNKAYEDARTLGRVYINQEPINEVLEPQVKALMRDGGFDVSSFDKRSKNVLEDLYNSKAIKGQKVTSQSLKEMELWRTRASNAANDAYGTSEGVAISRTIDAYDNFMENLPKHALMSGDDEAIEAFIKARSLRAEQGRLFDRNKIVSNLVKNNDLTNEELANMVLTGSSRSEKIHKGAGAVVKQMKNTIPEESQGVFVDNLKRGVMARVLNKSKGTTLVAGENIIHPNKLIKEIDGLLDNKTFVKEVFKQDEQNLLFALRNDLEKIQSVQAGADNYSNTAYALMRFFNKTPMLGTFGKIAEFEGQRMSNAAAKRAFSPIIEEFAEELRGAPRFYGSVSGGAVAAQGGQE